VDSGGKRAVESDDCDCGDLKSQRPQGLIGVGNGYVWNVLERDLDSVENDDAHVENLLGITTARATAGRPE
jgi:hypothetical protein